MSVGLEERAGSAARPRAGSDARRGAASSRASGAVHAARLVPAALWLGGAAFFSFAVAPSAFAVLPTRELAGALVSRTLSVVNTGGFVVGILLLLTLPVGRAAVRRGALRAEALALSVVTAASGVGQWVIAARLLDLRARMPAPIDLLGTDDPLRVAFNDLHGYSVAALSAAMLAGLVALVLIARRTK